jgi:microcystin-dependent protein
MPVTTAKLALRTPVTADNNDTPTYMLNLATDIVASLDFGTFAARPAASVANQGRRYYATDRDREYFNTAAGAWTPLGAEPPGEIASFLVTAIPTGWLLCDGTTVTGAQTLYPDLWAVLPTASKSGADFITPDYRARSPIGADNYGVGSGGARGNLAGLIIGATTGANTKTIAATNMPTHAHDMSHNHSINNDDAGAHSHEIMFSNSGGGGLVQYACTQVPNSNVGGVGNYAGGPRHNTYAVGDHTHFNSINAISASTGNSGNGVAMNVVNDSLAVMYCIRT